MSRHWSDGLRERLKGDRFVVGSDLHRLEMAVNERDEMIKALRVARSTISNMSHESPEAEIIGRRRLAEIDAVLAKAAP